MLIADFRLLNAELPRSKDRGLRFTGV